MDAYQSEIAPELLPYVKDGMLDTNKCREAFAKAFLRSKPGIAMCAALVIALLIACFTWIQSDHLARLDATPSSAGSAQIRHILDLCDDALLITMFVVVPICLFLADRQNPTPLALKLGAKANRAAMRNSLWAKAGFALVAVALCGLVSFGEFVVPHVDQNSVQGSRQIGYWFVSELAIEFGAIACLLVHFKRHPLIHMIPIERLTKPQG